MKSSHCLVLIKMNTHRTLKEKNNKYKSEMRQSVKRLSKSIKAITEKPKPCKGATNRIGHRPIKNAAIEINSRHRRCGEGKNDWYRQNITKTPDQTGKKPQRVVQKK